MMTKEEAFEKLELPFGSDLQTVRKKFAAMHNDYRMQIDNAFNPTSKRIFEQKLEELKEAYALLNESEGMDDLADLPRTGKSYEGNQEYQYDAGEKKERFWTRNMAFEFLGIDDKLTHNEIKRLCEQKINFLKNKILTAQSLLQRRAAEEELYDTETAVKMVLQDPRMKGSYVDNDHDEASDEEKFSKQETSISSLSGKQVWRHLGLFFSSVLTLIALHGLLIAPKQENDLVFNILASLITAVVFAGLSYLAMIKLPRKNIYITLAIALFFVFLGWLNDRYNPVNNVSEKINLVSSERHGRIGFTDTLGNEVIPFIYTNVLEFSEDLVGVERGDLWGFIDMNGNTVIPFEYEYVRSFLNGVAEVMKNENRFYINKNGECVRGDCPN